MKAESFTGNVSEFLNETPRGVIRNREYAGQLRDFSGLVFIRNISPTDIDGFIDFGYENKFVFFEAKFGNHALEGGQRKAYARLCDTSQKGGVDALVIFANHVSAPEMDIPFATLLVREYRWHGRWSAPRGRITIRQLVDRYLVLGVPEAMS